MKKIINLIVGSFLFLLTAPLLEAVSSTVVNGVVSNSQINTPKRRCVAVHEWFAKEVDDYFLQSKKLAKEIVIFDQQVIKELHNAFDCVTTCKSPGKLIALLARIRSAYDNSVAQGHETHVDQTVHERSRCAFLLKISVKVANLAHMMLLDLLHEFDTYEWYWKEQYNHPARYFFHKSPFKWFSGKKQFKEIEDNLKIVQKAQAHYYEMLGSLTAHLHTFNSKISVGQQYKWLGRLLQVLPGKSSVQKQVTFYSIAERMQHNLMTLLSYKHMVLKKIGHAKMQNHFVRHWITYTGVLAGTALIGNYWYKNPEKIHAVIGKEAFKKYWESILSTFIYYKNSVKETWNQLFNNGLSLEEIKHQREQIKKNKKIYIDSAMDTLKGGLQDKWITQEKYDKIISALELGDRGPLLEWFRELKQSTKKNLVTGPLAQVFLNVIDFELLHPIGEAMLSIKEILVENKALFKLLTPVVAMRASYWGLSNLYRWTTKKDYYVIRQALMHVNSLLIESPSNMSNYDYGKLVYLLHTLRYNAISCIPRTKKMRQEFCDDIVKLESYDFSVEEKRAIIENMRAHYSFLSPVFTG